MRLDKNIVVNGKQTLIQLDADIWQDLVEICQAENISLSDLCSLIDGLKGSAELTCATRLFIITYHHHSLLSN